MKHPEAFDDEYEILDEELEPKLMLEEDTLLDEPF